MKAMQDSMPGMTVRQILLCANGPQFDGFDSNYLRMARVGRDTTYIGANLAARA